MQVMDRLRPPFLLLAAAVICLLLLGNVSAAQAHHEALRYKSMSFSRLSVKEGLSQVAGEVATGKPAPERCGRTPGKREMPDSRLDSAAEIMERLRQAVASHEFKWKGKTLRITITAGLGTGMGRNLDASLQPADQALFLGKEKGRNRLVIAQTPA